MKNIVIFIAIIALNLPACAQQKTELTASSSASSNNSANNSANTSANTSSNNPANISAKLDTTLPWLQIKIWDYQSKPLSSPPRSVVKTTFEGKPVYYVPAVCCDIPSELYAEDGKLICYPSGGITGNGDGKCAKFRFEYLDNKTNPQNSRNSQNPKNNNNTVVWEDKRKPAVDTKPTRVVPNLQ